MVLCRNCAHQAFLTTIRCPRCGWGFPYYRSRRWKPRISTSFPPVTVGKECPHCGRRTHRDPTPFWLRLLRPLALHRCSYRSCQACGWRGTALHGRETMERT